MRLEASLVLNRYLHSLFGATTLDELKGLLRRIEEGPGGDGHSRFFHALANLRGLALAEEKLKDYDGRIVSYESRLRDRRDAFAFKYFQYLGLLHTEIYLDRLTEDPVVLAAQLNAFLQEPGSCAAAGAPFEPDDLRRLAFFMATGSGKTLLLHVNLWQVLHYLQHGRHPEALVQRPDSRREFESTLLVTPNEGLSQQHLQEFARSGIDAVRLTEERLGPTLLGPLVQVIEIHKLSDEPSRDGVSLLLDELGTANLVFVDEGHKGTGSEAQTWKTRQRRLSSDGFLLEYSATFAQSIAAASKKVQAELLAEYGKTVVFDYSYRHFYHDGYGKDFRVLNLARGREEQAHELLLGGLLTYYQQLHLHRQGSTAYRAYNVERPLWVFLGSSVNAVYSRQGSRRSDVAAIVAFLRRLLEEPGWAIDRLGAMAAGKSGFTDDRTGDDLFRPYLQHLPNEDGERLYKGITRELFYGRGGLEVWQLKAADGELGLRLSAAEGEASPYFGVINIGDVPAFKRYLEEHLGMGVREDHFTPSLFDEINAADSRINILVGAKKFIEGWSSWRVSSMGLLNIGKGEGPQVIQLFGRGVRLKGKKWTLKRSSALPEEGPHPEGVELLETLFIFGWNADHIRQFRTMLEREEVGHERQIQLQLFEPAMPLLIPRPRPGFRPEAETWTLGANAAPVSVDLAPEIASMAGTVVGTARATARIRANFEDPGIAGLIDMEQLYADVLDYKMARGYGNVFVPRSALQPILEASDLFLTEDDLRAPDFVQEGATRLVTAYFDRFIARTEREAESRHLEPRPLVLHEHITPYTVRVSDELLEDLEALVLRPAELLRDDTGPPLPRLYVDRHLFNPVLLDPGDWGLEGVAVSPPGLRQGEARLLRDLRDFWSAHHDEESFRDLEITLLRNVPRVGVGFFRRSGFYPDFMLWIRRVGGERTHVRFLEPHGMSHGGLAGNQDKIAALKDLKALSAKAPFLERQLSLSGYLLTETRREDIPDAGDKPWSALERDYRLLPQEGHYVRKLFMPE